jgi:hypothetical protein
VTKGRKADVSERAAANIGAPSRPLADACPPVGRDPECVVGRPCPFSGACDTPSGSCPLAQACRYTVVLPSHGPFLTKIPAVDFDQVKHILEERDPNGRGWVCDRDDPSWRLRRTDL